MKKLILTFTTVVLFFSSYSYAEHTNYYVKQEQQAKQNTTINTTISQDKPFVTQQLNEDSRVNNK